MKGNLIKLAFFIAKSIKKKNIKNKKQQKLLPREINNKNRDGTAGKFESTDPIYQAVWADTVDFNEVLISPVMVHDHMPDTVLRALNKVTYNNHHTLYFFFVFFFLY